MGLTARQTILRTLVIPSRLATGSSHLGHDALHVARWLVRSREHTNFTYELETLNQAYLASFLSVVTSQPTSVIDHYVDEIDRDDALKDHVRSMTQRSERRFLADEVARFGRRVGWYALVRATKPQVVIETGVDKGLGSVVLAAALLRNRNEGKPGRLFGTDINPKAGYLLSGRYAEVGRVLYGDSLESLRRFSEPVDLFINDSDHSPDYEREEYHAIAPRLSRNAYIIGDNAHCSDRLYRFAAETGREFLFFREQPKEHWYPGGGMGIAFRRPDAQQGA